MANTALPTYDMILVASASPSAASTVDFTGLSATYIAYQVIIGYLDPSADSDLLFRTSTDGGSTYDSGASDYEYARNTLTSTSSVTGGTASSIELLNGGGGTGTNESISGHIWIDNPSDAEFTSVRFNIIGTDTAGSRKVQVGGGRRQSAADVDAIRILPSTGTVTGEVRLYGIKAS